MRALISLLIAVLRDTAWANALLAPFRSMVERVPGNTER